jgi:S1-C subfamily serine protease
MPARAAETLRAFNKTLDANLFPRYIDPFEDERITAVDPPNDATLQQAGVRRASESVVKVIGMAQCDRGVEGSGFVYSAGRVMTNAHVVAGVDEPFIEVNGRRTRANVVLFNARLDVAVLSTGDLGLTPLEFDTSGQAGDEAAILGYPQNGPFDARAARIRGEISLRSPDIYDRGEHVRKTYSVRGLVRSGNSGGPLVSTGGGVLGVIFAASVTDSSTGYALTAAQVANAADRGVASSSRVDTGGCA